MFQALAKWSKERLLWTLALSYVAILEGASWLTSKGPLCIVEAEQNRCPTFLAFFITSVADTLERLGHDWIIALSAVITAIFTGTLWWSTRRLWKAGEIHSERQLRAYVMIDAVNVENLTLGGCPEARLTIKNSGQTPAFNLTHWARMGFYTFPLTSPVPPRTTELLPPRPLAPGATVHVHTGISKELNPATLNALEIKSHAIYVVGEIRYEDAFGVPRETDFCLFCTGPQVAKGSMASYNTGNRIT
jgi:hypothetical protein